MKGTPVYQEFQGLSTVLKILITAGLIIMAWYAFTSQIILEIPFGKNPTPDAILIIIWIFLGIILPLCFIFGGLKIIIATDGVYISMFWVFNKYLPYDSIKTYKVLSINPVRDFGGIGYKISPKYGVGFIMSGKEGIQFELNNNKKIFVTTTQKDKFLEALRMFIKVKER